ncbi:MAG: PilZ domain-containing protein [Candidatus Omnitrophica bacterium]|nr:PilZ domain-containing protein [Candidatus Omnitrophota bacterium]
MFRKGNEVMKKEELKDKGNQGSMQIIEFRHFIRHPVCLPLAYKVINSRVKESKEEIRSETVNVSLGGLLFPGKYPVKPGAGILIKMPFEGKLFNIKAKVVRSVNNPKTKLYDIAVNFPRSQEAFKVKMIEQIYLIAEYRDLLSLEEGTDVTLEEASRKWIKQYSEQFRKLYW